MNIADLFVRRRGLLSGEDPADEGDESPEGLHIRVRILPPRRRTRVTIAPPKRRPRGALRVEIDAGPAIAKRATATVRHRRSSSRH